MTASLKAAQVSSTLEMYQAQVSSVATRVLIQNALRRYNAGMASLDITTFSILLTRCSFLGNQSSQNFASSQSDLAASLANGNLLVQAMVFPADDTGNRTSLNGLLNVTATDLNNTFRLPYNDPNGIPVYLGDVEGGYPASLYPNLTYSSNTTSTSSNVSYMGRQLDPHRMLILGPLVLNETSALLSATTGIINNTSFTDLLGWITVLIRMDMIYEIDSSPEGLGNTGEVLLVGPTQKDNLFSPDLQPESTTQIGEVPVQFILPPSTAQGRHRQRGNASTSTTPFSMSSYPAVEAAWTQEGNGLNHNGAYISTRNEEAKRVSAGYARVTSSNVDWVVVVEQSHGEVTAPIQHLRDVVLICVFSVTGLLLLVIFPIAHYSVTPIRQLRAATKRAVEPYQPGAGSEYSSSIAGLHSSEEGDEALDFQEARKEGFFGTRGLLRSTSAEATFRNRRKKTFRIPRKVQERKHWITDELTELTSTFNEMSDELATQYQRLEERVKVRTAELEKSKKAAESANQSKTLFIANISHELKTPLNGILGLTTVCMNENDPHKIRSTLNTIYKSGDLLLHLLTDLLTFSKNEVGQQLSIDETEFRISDLSMQLMPTFERQAREAQVNLSVHFYGSNDAFGDGSDYSGEKLYGPAGTGRVRDMCLWGDKNRILQVLMNFVSNSLKFTPAHGSVTVSIRCVGLKENLMLSRADSARKSSFNSRKSRGSSSKRVRMSDASIVKGQDSPDDISDRPNHQHHPHSHTGEDGKLSINVGGGVAQIPRIAERRRSMSPPPLNTKDLVFDIEVEDTGPGIPEDQQKMIFDPFVQGDLGLSKKYGGTGLGLSICAQLAGLMGGDISLWSQVGKGSRFTMRIPLRYVSERTPSLSSTHRSHSKASSIAREPLHDEAEVNSLHHPTGSNTSVTLKLEDTVVEPKLADVPRIVGFSHPFVAKETSSENAEAKISQMKKAETEAAKQGKKVKVLVAEDNPVNQEVVLRMLKLEDVYGEQVLLSNYPRC